jgi:hypothetical protein
VPEIFCWTLLMRRSRSIKLLVKGVQASQRADQFQKLDLAPDMIVDGGLPAHQLLGVSLGLCVVRHLVDPPRPFLVELPASR